MHRIDGEKGRVDKNMGFGIKQNWILILALSVIIDKLFNLSDPQSCHLYLGLKTTFLQG